MSDIREEYTFLFNAISHTIENLEDMRKELIQAQTTAEEIYITGER